MGHDDSLDTIKREQELVISSISVKLYSWHVKKLFLLLANEIGLEKGEEGGEEGEWETGGEYRPRESR